MLRTLLALLIGVGLGVVGSTLGLIPGLEQVSAPNPSQEASPDPLIPDFDVTDYVLEDWPDIDEDCRDARMEVLIALGLDLVLDENKCTVLSGRWRDEFTGEPITSLDEVKIVNLVPLAHAHMAGGYAWPADRKQDFAYRYELAEQMSFSPQAPLASNLIIVRQDPRQDRSITDWQPDGQAAKCTYAKRWVTVKTLWQLSVDDAERETLDTILRGCI